MRRSKTIVVCFVQDKTMDLFNFDPSDDIVPIGSLDNGDGEVSVTRRLALFPMT
jgi:hypothetical protein